MREPPTRLKIAVAVPLLGQRRAAVAVPVTRAAGGRPLTLGQHALPAGMQSREPAQRAIGLSASAIGGDGSVRRPEQRPVEESGEDRPCGCAPGRADDQVVELDHPEGRGRVELRRPVRVVAKCVKERRQVDTEHDERSDHDEEHAASPVEPSRRGTPTCSTASWTRSAMPWTPSSRASETPCLSKNSPTRTLLVISTCACSKAGAAMPHLSMST